MSALSLAPRALYEEVAELMRQRIYRRELAPGSWIDELKIAEEYGISRTPLREALKVLAAEGLVTMKVRRGAYVTEVSEKDLSNVYHLLSLLESDAAGVVAQTATADELKELQGLHDELEAAAQDRDRFFALNERFHMRLLEIGRQPLARPDGGRSAQGHEAESPELVVEEWPHCRIVGRAPRHHASAAGSRCDSHHKPNA
jgi:DNA-binding GntR family transcriptional regulator